MDGFAVASMFAKVGADVSDFDKKMQGVKSDVSAFDKTAQAIGTSVDLAFKVAAAAVAAFTTAIAFSVAKAADFQQGVTDISATMGLTAVETDKLQEHILKLGLSDKLKVSATEASEAIMSLGTAGLTATQIMGGASEATILLANATGLSGGSGLATAASIATDVMGQFNITASGMKGAVDQIVGATVASKFSIDDMRLAYAQAGGVAGSVGVNFQDFNAIIAAISPSFASGSDAGTSFKTLLQRLVPQTDGAREAMAKLGLITNEGGSAFFDASGKMKSAEEVAGLLQKAFGGLSDSQKIEAASTIFGTDSMRAALSLASGGPAIITKMKQTIGNTSAEEMAAKRMDTFKGSMEIAQGVIETLTISIGQKFLPVLRPLIDRFSELAQTYGPALVEFFGKLAERLASGLTQILSFTKGTGGLWDGLKNVWDIVQKVTEAVQLALTPVAETISKYLSWKDVLTAVGVILGGALLSAIGAIIAAMWPVVTTVAAVTAAVAALRVAWENDFFGIRTATYSVLQSITNWFINDSGIWKGTWQDTLDYLEWWASGGWKNSVYFPIRSALIDLGVEFNEWKMKTVYYFNEWKDKVVETVTLWYERTKNKIGDFVNETVAKYEWWKGEIINYIDDFIDINMTKFTTWKNNTVATFKEWGEKAIGFFQPVFDWWDEHISPMIQKGRDWIQGLWDGVKEKWNQFINWWKDVWNNSVQWVKDLLGIKSPSTVFHGIGSDVMQGMANGVNDNAKLVTGALQKVGSQMMSDAEIIGKGITTAFSTAGTALGDYYKKLLDAQIAAAKLASMPILPNYPTTPTLTPGTANPNGTNNQQTGTQLLIPATPTPGNDAYGFKDIGTALASLGGFVDTTDTLADIARFAARADAFLTAPGQPQMQGSSAENLAIRSLTGGGVDSLSVNNLLAMLQDLIRVLKERGFTQQFNITQAPDATLQQSTELEQFVTYFNALYG